MIIIIIIIITIIMLLLLLSMENQQLIWIGRWNCLYLCTENYLYNVDMYALFCCYYVFSLNKLYNLCYAMMP